MRKEKITVENNHDKSTYEAQFAALMHALGGRLGADALEENAALQKDLAAVVPESVRRRCMEIIARHGTATERSVRRVLLRIAVAALVTLLLFATAFAVSPTLREKTITFFKEVFDTHTEFRMSESNGVDLTGYTIETGWLPEGMELVEDIGGSLGRSLCFESGENVRVRIGIYSLRKGTAAIDSEQSPVQPITIHGQPALLVTNGNSVQIIVENYKASLLVKLSCEQITTDDLFRIAENLKISQK